MGNISGQHWTEKSRHGPKSVGQTHQQASIAGSYVEMIDGITSSVYTRESDTKNKKYDTQVTLWYVARGHNKYPSNYTTWWEKIDDRES